MAVTFDAQDKVQATTVTTVDLTTLTVGSGANRVLLARLHLGGPTTARTVVWDPAGTNQSLTLIAEIANGSGPFTALWGLVAPTSGNLVLRASWTTSRSVVLGGIAWTGADQAGGATTFAHAATAIGTSTTPSITVTSAAGNAVVDASTDGDNYNSGTQTVDYIDNTSATAGGSRAAGAASVVMEWTIASSDNWASAGVDIVAAAAGGGATLPPASRQYMLVEGRRLVG